MPVLIWPPSVGRPFAKRVQRLVAPHLFYFVFLVGPSKICTLYVRRPIKSNELCSLLGILVPVAQ